jgi:Flp pilus assembly CpaF family ATPase
MDDERTTPRDRALVAQRLRWLADRIDSGEIRDFAVKRLRRAVASESAIAELTSRKPGTETEMAC